MRSILSMFIFFAILPLSSQVVRVFNQEADSLTGYKEKAIQDSLRKRKDSLYKVSLAVEHENFLKAYCKSSSVILAEINSYSESKDSIEYGLLVLDDLKGELQDSTLITLKLNKFDCMYWFEFPPEKVFYRSMGANNVEPIMRKAMYVFYICKNLNSTYYVSSFKRNPPCFLIHTIFSSDTVKQQLVKTGYTNSEKYLDGIFISRGNHYLLPQNYGAQVPGFISESLPSWKYLLFIPLDQFTEFMRKKYKEYGK